MPSVFYIEINVYSFPLEFEIKLLRAVHGRHVYKEHTPGTKIVGSHLSGVFISYLNKVIVNVRAGKYSKYSKSSIDFPLHTGGEFS